MSYFVFPALDPVYSQLPAYSQLPFYIRYINAVKQADNFEVRPVSDCKHTRQHQNIIG